MVHKAAAQGFAKAATTYQAGRPDYPAAAMDWLRDTLGIRPGSTVLELGAGTGKFTQSLVKTGAHIIATDAVPQMLVQLKMALPKVETCPASAEQIPLSDSSVDYVVCAQAFHWFANTQTLQEVHRVLKPGGTFALIWNSRDQNTPWVETLSQIMRPYGGDAPRHDSGEWKRLFPAPEFTPLSTQSFPHSHTGPVEEVIYNRVLSTSFIAALEETQQAEVTAKVKALIEETVELKGKAVVTFPYITTAHHCIKL